jgi:hypothetical protein
MIDPSQESELRDPILQVSTLRERIQSLKQSAQSSRPDQSRGEGGSESKRMSFSTPLISPRDSPEHSSASGKLVSRATSKAIADKIAMVIAPFESWTNV